MARWRAALTAQHTAFVLAATRRLGSSPPRAVAERLPTKALLQEMELRGLDVAACVERSDLLEALCGPPAPSTGPEHVGRVADEEV